MQTTIPSGDNGAGVDKRPRDTSWAKVSRQPSSSRKHRDAPVPMFFVEGSMGDQALSEGAGDGANNEDRDGPLLVERYSKPKRLIRRWQCLVTIRSPLVYPTYKRTRDEDRE